MKHTILLADDSVTIQKVVELTFLDEDVRVVSVGNGSDALARLDEVNPDLVLADVHMPGATGYEVCAAARRSHPGLPVLLLVGTFEMFDAEKSASVGAAGHLKKPFDSQDLLRRVRELLAAGRSAGAVAPPPAPEPAAWEPEPDFAPPAVAFETAFEPAFEPVALAAERFEPAGEAVADAFEPVAESEPAPVEAEAGGDWSFEPVINEIAPAVVEAPAQAQELWNPLATTRFAAPAFEPLPVDPEPEPEIAPAPVEDARPVEPVAAPFVAAAATLAPAAAPSPNGGALSDADVERIARRVAELVSEKAVKEVAWEVVPDLAEVLLKARIRELEAAVE